MKTRAWLATITGATLVATVGVVTLGTLPAANATGEVAAGSITISTVYGNPGSGTATFTPPTGSPRTETLGRGQRCALTASRSDVINVASSPSGSGGTPGFGYGGIGVS